MMPQRDYETPGWRLADEVTRSQAISDMEIECDGRHGNNCNGREAIYGLPKHWGSSHRDLKDGDRWSKPKPWVVNTRKARRRPRARSTKPWIPWKNLLRARSARLDRRPKSHLP